MPEIGETLRDARMRARIDVSEIEAKTKIRAKYLRALENEEWGLLPGPTFVKSFLRTYAQALGLDGKALVEEYRLSHENLSEAALEPIVSSPQHARSRPSGPGGRAPGGPSRAYMVIVGVVGLVIVLLIVGLLSGGGGGSSNTDEQHGFGRTPSHRPCPSGREAGLWRFELTTGHGGAVAAGIRSGVRVPDRRQRAQADPRDRTAAR